MPAVDKLEEIVSISTMANQRAFPSSAETIVNAGQRSLDRVFPQALVPRGLGAVPTSGALPRAYAFPQALVRGLGAAPISHGGAVESTPSPAEWWKFDPHTNAWWTSWGKPTRAPQSWPGNGSWREVEGALKHWFWYPEPPGQIVWIGETEETARPVVSGTAKEVVAAVPAWVGPPGTWVMTLPNYYVWTSSS